MTSMRSIQPLALFLCGLVVSAAAGQANPPPKEDEPKPMPRVPLPEGVFLQSGDIQIMAKDVEAVMAQFLTYQKKTNPRNVPEPDTLLKARAQIAERLLQNEVLIKYTKDHHLTIKPQELTLFIDTVRAQCKQQGTTFEQMLIDSGQSEAEFQAFHSARLALQTAAASAVSDEDVQKHYNENYTTVPLRSAAHILVQYKKADSAERTVTRTKEEARAMAEELLKQLKAGKDFGELAKEGDDAAAAAKGGDVGYFPLVGKGQNAMTPEFAKAAYELKEVGDLSPVIESPYGFHIIKLTGNRDKEYKREIRAQLTMEKSNAMIQPIFKEAVEHEEFSQKLTSLAAQAAKTPVQPQPVQPEQK